MDSTDRPESAAAFHAPLGAEEGITIVQGFPASQSVDAAATWAAIEALELGLLARFCGSFVQVLETHDQTSPVACTICMGSVELVQDPLGADGT
jgi:hypothetical protein